VSSSPLGFVPPPAATGDIHPGYVASSPPEQDLDSSNVTDRSLVMRRLYQAENRRRHVHVARSTGLSFVRKDGAHRRRSRQAGMVERKENESDLG